MRVLVWTAFLMSAFGQCGPMVLNPITGQLQCRGPKGADGSQGPVGPIGGQGPVGSVPVPNSRTLTAASSPYTVAANDYYLWLDTSGGDIACNLATAAGRAGTGYSFYKTNAAHKLTVSPLGTQKINGAATYTVIGHAQIVSDGANWWAW